MTDSTAAFRLEPDPEPQPDHERPAKGRNGAVMNTNHLTDEQLLNFAYAYAAHHGSTADAMRAALATLPEPAPAPVVLPEVTDDDARSITPALQMVKNVRLGGDLLPLARKAGLCSGRCKPEGVAVELADCIIRCLDTMHSLGVDIDAVVAEKMAYNAARPFKHNKAY